METNEIAGFREEYFFLSNFYTDAAVPFEMLGRTRYVRSGEHLFHAQKVFYLADPAQNMLDWLGRIFRAQTPAKAKYQGRVIPIEVERWNRDAYNNMLYVQRQKFSVPELRHLLDETGDAMLKEENSWGDRLWGTVNGQGLNQLGKILMVVREENRNA